MKSKNKTFKYFWRKIFLLFLFPLEWGLIFSLSFIQSIFILITDFKWELKRILRENHLDLNFFKQWMAYVKDV